MENALINLSICLSDIPKDRIKKASNGKLYVGLTIRKRKEKDQYEQDIYSFISQTKEEREAKADKVYTGNGRYIEFYESIDEMKDPSVSDTDDLPF